MPHWYQASKSDLYLRVMRLEAELSCVVAALEDSQPSPVSIEIIQRAKLLLAEAPPEPQA